MSQSPSTVQLKTVQIYSFLICKKQEFYRSVKSLQKPNRHLIA